MTFQWKKFNYKITELLQFLYICNNKYFELFYVLFTGGNRTKWTEIDGKFFDPSNTQIILCTNIFWIPFISYQYVFYELPVLFIQKQYWLLQTGFN